MTGQDSAVVRRRHPLLGASEQPTQRHDTAIRVDRFPETRSGQLDFREKDLRALRYQTSDPSSGCALVALRVVPVEQA